jgi:cyanophycinase-like exopeptidase
VVFITGTPTDNATASTPGLLLMGGGTDVDTAFHWMISRAGGGNFVVLNAWGDNGYNDYLFNMGGLASVISLSVGLPETASLPYVLDTVRNASAIFIEGGYQGNYVDSWKGTPLEDAVNYATNTKGVPIGGTSAGLAILGQYFYGALNNKSVDSKQALNNPYNSDMELGTNFFALPFLGDKISDTHFVVRDRMGRLVTFLARIAQDGWSASPLGFGIEQGTAVLVDEYGIGTVVGWNSASIAYFLTPNEAPKVCEPDTPLKYKNITVYRAPINATFDLARWQAGSGGSTYAISADAGTLTSTQHGGSVY